MQQENIQVMLDGEVVAQATYQRAMKPEELRALIRMIVREELERLDEHIDRRIEAALKQQVRDRRTGGRNLEYK